MLAAEGALQDHLRTLRAQTTAMRKHAEFDRSLKVLSDYQVELEKRIRAEYQELCDSLLALMETRSTAPTNRSTSGEPNRADATAATRRRLESLSAKLQEAESIGRRACELARARAALGVVPADPEFINRTERRLAENVAAMRGDLDKKTALFRELIGDAT